MLVFFAEALETIHHNKAAIHSEAVAAEAGKHFSGYKVWRVCGI